MRRSVLDHLLSRDRAIVIGGLVAAVLLSWAYLLHGAGLDMTGMDMSGPGGAATRGAGYLALLFVMWAVMMAAMMLPSAAPMILFYAAIARRRRELGEIGAKVGIFAAGYVLVWTAFSLGAAMLQWRLEAAALLSPGMEVTGAAAGILLIAAGIYQWTPLKRACLRRCRSPLGFVLTEWREGARGALVMGLRHGLFCLGCCWALMLLLFVGGVMNLLWIGLVALIVLLEKVAPAGGWHARIGGVALALWGAGILLTLP
jgi:predicted metal-binding membrane protein